MGHFSLDMLKITRGDVCRGMSWARFGLGNTSAAALVSRRKFPAEKQKSTVSGVLGAVEERAPGRAEPGGYLEETEPYGYDQYL
jgi:hypothetical protein